ncbi:UDP-N-acetylmuramate dehydrogenase [Candidatus Microgenomates bacterium]|nr:UDP-N-acetylmuramate dehydrogenase [Candidatus Microgenomates bacterium]
MNILENVSASTLTTLRIGGPIKYLAAAFSVDDLIQLIKKAKDENLPYLVVGGGSNLLVADNGYKGMIIQNLIRGIERKDELIEVGSGTDLHELVWWADENGIAGFEKMAGIPGTVGGAVYGNAGAYGQTISDNLLWVEAFELKTFEVKRLTKLECEFGYRDSGFKRKKDIILRVGFLASKGDAFRLDEISRETVAMRVKKYTPGLAVPGSFFKNIEADKLNLDLLKNIPEDKIIYGKIPAGWLLEEVGAKGKRNGNVVISENHANLFINEGGGTANAFLSLAREYKDKVKEKFGIDLEPEVQLVGFERNPLE